MHIGTVMPDNHVMPQIHVIRLQKLIRDRRTNPTALAERANVGRDTVRDILRRKSRSPRYETAQALAHALDVDVQYLFGEQEVERSGRGAQREQLKAIPVVGTTRAGWWRDMQEEPVHVTDMQDWDGETVPGFADPDFPNAVAFALRIEGDSIDELCVEGGYAICVRFADTGLEIRDGMMVVAVQVDGRFQQTTIKEVRIRTGRIELHPRSRNPEHKPILVPPRVSGEEVEIQALVRRFISPPLDAWKRR